MGWDNSGGIGTGSSIRYLIKSKYKKIYSTVLPYILGFILSIFKIYKGPPLAIKL
jgi:hypothetical protein